MGTVRSLPLSDASFLKRLRAIAKDSHRVYLTPHAKQRMMKRRINLPQVLECLRRGQICEPAHLTFMVTGKRRCNTNMRATGSRSRSPSKNRMTATWLWL